MAKKKIVFQIKSFGAIGKPKIDLNPLYEHAIEVEQGINSAHAEAEIIEHASYLRDVLNGKAKRDDVKYPGILWKHATAPADYINVEPDSWIGEGELWSVAVLDKWADSQGLKHEYVRKADPVTGAPASYNSHHIFL